MGVCSNKNTNVVLAPLKRLNFTCSKLNVNEASYSLCLKQEGFFFEIIEFNILFNKKTRVKQSVYFQLCPMHMQACVERFLFFFIIRHIL